MLLEDPLVDETSLQPEGVLKDQEKERQGDTAEDSQEPEYRAPSPNICEDTTEDRTDGLGQIKLVNKARARKCDLTGPRSGAI